MTDLSEFIRGLPKAELHLHIEGTLEPELMFEIAERNDIALPFTDVDDLRAAYDFDDLQSFLDLYYEGAGVLVAEQDFYDLTRAYLDRARADGVTHAEIFFDPQTHTDRNVELAAVMNGITRALDEAAAGGLSSKLILCFLRHLSEDAALETWEQAQPFLDRIAGVGLDSGERDNPPEKFARVFAKAREAGLHVVAHAGEEGPADYITQALDVLKVERVDHGVRCLEDRELVARLARERIPLTVCPLSNVRLRVFQRMEEHNLEELIDAGLVVTVSSDDPAYFGGYVADNFLAVHESLGLHRDVLVNLARASFEASFLDDEEKAAKLAELDAYVAEHAS
jgi:adenosine deaminase